MPRDRAPRSTARAQHDPEAAANRRAHPTGSGPRAKRLRCAPPLAWRRSRDTRSHPARPCAAPDSLQRSACRFRRARFPFFTFCCGRRSPCEAERVVAGLFRRANQTRIRRPRLLSALVCFFAGTEIPRISSSLAFRGGISTGEAFGSLAAPPREAAYVLDIKEPPENLSPSYRSHTCTESAYERTISLFRTSSPHVNLLMQRGRFPADLIRTTNPRNILRNSNGDIYCGSFRANDKSSGAAPSGSTKRFTKRTRKPASTASRRRRAKISAQVRSLRRRSAELNRSEEKLFAT